jgi:hypothetical protein
LNKKNRRRNLKMSLRKERLRGKSKERYERRKRKMI